MKLISEYYSDNQERVARVSNTDEQTYLVEFYLTGEKTSYAYYNSLAKAEERAEDYVM